MTSQVTIMRKFRRITQEVNDTHFGGNLKYNLSIGDASGRTYAYVEFPSHFPSRMLTIPVVHIHPRALTLESYDIKRMMQHELVHVAQWFYGKKGGHGEDFREIGLRHGIPTEVLGKSIRFREGESC